MRRNSVADTVTRIFIRLAIAGFRSGESRKLPREFELRSRSSKVIDLGVNRKRICDFPNSY